MAESDRNPKDRLLKKVDDARDANLRWQEVRRTQLGHVVNIVLTLSTASLAFGVKMIVDKPSLTFHNSLFFSLAFLIIAILIGLLANFTRLWDFRYTAKAARARWLALRQRAIKEELPEEELTKEEGALKRHEFSHRANQLGRWTWSLFSAQLLVFLIGISLFVFAIYQYNTSARATSQTDQKDQTAQQSPADCTSYNWNNAVRRYDVIVIGAGIAGISATRELQHLGHTVLVLEANNRIGGRAYVGYIGDDKVPIDYGGAWLHPGAYESGLKAAREIHAAMLEEKARKDKSFNLLRPI